MGKIVEDKNAVQFAYQASQVEQAIEARLQSHIDVLRGAEALFSTSDRITRQQFHAYVETLDIARNFPGIKRICFARHVVAPERKAYEASIRNDNSIEAAGYPEFSIQPPGERDRYHVLTYIEPMQGHRALLGRDLWAFERNAKALSASRDNGSLGFSGKLTRANGIEDHNRLTMSMPLYRRGMPLNTVGQRRAAYYGTVIAAVDTQRLMSGVVDKNALRHLRTRMYDTGRSDETPKAGTSAPEHLLFDSAAQNGNAPSSSIAENDHAFVKRVTMLVGPRIWEVEFTANKAAMIKSFDAYFPWLVLTSGLVGSTLLYIIYYSALTSRRRATELAREMTKDLRSSEASLAEAQQMARLGSWVLDPETQSMTWSAETYRIFGINRALEHPQYEDFLYHLHPKDLLKVRKGIDHSLITGENFSMEHRIAQRNGSVRWVHTITRLSHGRNHLMLRGIIMDITERKATVEALKRSQESLRELTAYQERVKEEERKRIAREIHDELGQTLLALRIDVSLFEARTARSHPRLNEKVRAALNQIDATVKTVRSIINNLRPSVLDLGLNAAIEWQVAQFRNRNTITCDLVMDEKELAMDDARATSLFRILQESLTNVVRHAQASHVTITLYHESDGVVMTISDNGVGIDRDSRKSTQSFGLIGIEERIHALNGRFRIASTPDKGTTLTVYIPLATRSDAPDRLSLAGRED